MPKAVMTNNDREKFGAFAEFLKQQQLPHYFARPQMLKGKPHVERFIGTWEKGHPDRYSAALLPAECSATHCEAGFS